MLCLVSMCYPTQYVALLSRNAACQGGKEEVHVTHEVSVEGSDRGLARASISFLTVSVTTTGHHSNKTLLDRACSHPSSLRCTPWSTDRKLVGPMWSSQQLQLRRQSSAECCTSYSGPTVSHSCQRTPHRAACACPRRAGAWAARTKADSRSQTAAASWVAQDYSSTQPQGVRTASPAPEPVLPNFWKDSQELGERQLDTGLAPLTKTNLDLMLVPPAVPAAHQSPWLSSSYSLYPVSL